jgi:hypothetical protein
MSVRVARCAELFFYVEFRFRDPPNQLTSLEKLCLTDSDYDALTNILSLLTPIQRSSSGFRRRDLCEH